MCFDFGRDAAGDEFLALAGIHICVYDNVGLRHGDDDVSCRHVVCVGPTNSSGRFHVDELRVATDSHAHRGWLGRGVCRVAIALVLFARATHRWVRFVFGKFDSRVAWAKDSAVEPDRRLD